MKKGVKNVIFVSSNILSRHSADIIYIMEMCNAFSKNYFNTILYVPKFKQNKETLFEYYGVEYPFKIKEINVPEVFVRGVVPGRGFVFSLLASRRLSRMRDSIIYIRNPYVFFIVSVLYKQKCFFEAHQFRFNGLLQTFIYRNMIKLGLKKKHVGCLVCISKTLMKQWEAYGIDRRKIFVAHDAVNIRKFGTSYSKAEARKKIGIDPELSTVTYTGSLDTGKGVDLLVKCANRLPKIFFIIVGGRKEQIVKLRDLVKFNNVLFTGHVEPGKIPIYQAAADILALPNTKGGVIDDVTSPMKLFEYMASGRPIVATDMPSLLEILENDSNALISPAGDDYQLSENIKLIFNSPSRGEKLAKKAKQDLELHTWDARVQYLTKIFEKFS